MPTIAHDLLSHRPEAIFMRLYKYKLAHTNIRAFMKNLLILIVATALFLHFYPQPEVTKFYNEQKEALLDGFSDFSDTRVRLKSDKIFTDLESELDSFSLEEVEYLKEITSSRTNVKEFYQSYCQGNAKSMTFHSTNQASVCDTISQYENML